MCWICESDICLATEDSDSPFWPSNRMDSGKLESLSRVWRIPLSICTLPDQVDIEIKPYSFHQVIRSLFIPVRLVAAARGLEFEYNLDKNIDQVRSALSPI
jgi:hypothetical protein